MEEGFEELGIERRDKGKGEIRSRHRSLCGSLPMCRACYPNRGSDLNSGGEEEQVFGRISAVT